MTKISLFLLFLWPMTALSSPRHCSRSARYLLDNNRRVKVAQLALSDLKHALRDYIYQGKIHYSNHIRTRMQERFITEEDIESVLHKAYVIRKGKKLHEHNLYNISAQLRHHRLTVTVAFESNDSLLVVTAWRS